MTAIQSTHTSTRRHWVARGRPARFTESPEPEPGTLNLVTTPIDRAAALELAERIGGHAYMAGHHPVIRSDDGVYVTEAAQWFGQANIGSVADTTATWTWLQSELRRLWQDHRIPMLATPGTLGRDLWLRTISDDSTYPCAPFHVQKLIRDTSPQARVQIFPARNSNVSRLFEYDLALAYAAVMRGLPIGAPQWLSLGKGDGLADDLAAMPARWRIDFRPPRSWDHVGIFSVRNATGGLDWPTSHEWHGPTWADGCEVQLAMRNGWSVWPSEVVVWPERGEPMRTWRERLVRLEQAARKLPGERAGMARYAVRALLLHTVGAMFGKPHKVEHHGQAADVPADADAVRLYGDGTASWVVEAAPQWPETSHPEWSAHIWARARVRLLSGPGGTGLLSLDPARVVAVRTDAVYVDGPTGWDETPAAQRREPGTWQLKRHRQTPCAWPRSAAELLAVRDG